MVLADGTLEAGEVIYKYAYTESQILSQNQVARGPYFLYVHAKRLYLELCIRLLQ
jgi:hypothetical protein